MLWEATPEERETMADMDWDPTRAEKAHINFRLRLEQQRLDLLFSDQQWMKQLRHDYKSVPSRKRRIVERTCAACAVFIEYAPPASTFLHALHFQIPTAVRFTESFPQKRHVKRECWETSIFFTCLRSDEPYRTPYLPVIPTFLVLFCVWSRGRGRALRIC